MDISKVTPTLTFAKQLLPLLGQTSQSHAVFRLKLLIALG